LEGAEDFMAAAGSMEVAVTLPGGILVAVAMDGVAVVMGGVAVTDVATTVAVAGMDEVGTVEDMGVVGMVVVRGMAGRRIGGGVTPIRTVTGMVVGNNASGQESSALPLSMRSRRFQAAHEPAETNCRS
jgi:hypothetical protein